jgi:hypothetical protein
MVLTLDGLFLYQLRHLALLPKLKAAIVLLKSMDCPPPTKPNLYLLPPPYTLSTSYQYRQVIQIKKQAVINRKHRTTSEQEKIKFAMLAK